MKTLLLFASVAALVALVSAPTAAFAGSLLFGATVMILFAADYRRVIQPLTPQAVLVAFSRPEHSCGLAA